MAHNWKVILKHTGITFAEVGVIGTSMILTTKFLDAKTIFKDQIAADPTYANKWYVKHQGAVKLAVGAGAACFVKNPWLKMVAIGFALQGFIQEARLLTTDTTTGTAMFDAIGAPTKEDLDNEMMEAAHAVKNNTSGFGNRFDTTVAGTSGFGNRFDTTVAGMGWQNDVNLMDRGMSTVTGVAGYY